MLFGKKMQQQASPMQENKQKPPSPLTMPADKPAATDDAMKKPVTTVPLQTQSKAPMLAKPILPPNSMGFTSKIIQAKRVFDTTSRL
jgi:hypothetical protein